MLALTPADTAASATTSMHPCDISTDRLPPIPHSPHIKSGTDHNMTSSLQITLATSLFACSPQAAMCKMYDEGVQTTLIIHNKESRRARLADPMSPGKEFLKKVYQGEYPLLVHTGDEEPLSKKNRKLSISQCSESNRRMLRTRRTMACLRPPPPANLLPVLAQQI
jgi:hypothetical protein